MKPLRHRRAHQPSLHHLAGVNGTWEDNSDGTCTDCTYSVSITNTGPNVFFLAIFYQTDSTCPAALGTELMNVDVGSNGSMLNDAPGFTNIQLCTRASNPVVADCGQQALWSAPYNVTVSQTSISGEYQGQYWTWDTDANGDITNCRIDHNYSQPFTLTPVFSAANQTSSTASSSAATSEQNTQPISSSQSSSRSTTNSSSTSTSTHTKGSGLPGLEIIILAAAVLVVLAGVSWVFLSRRR